MTTPAPTRTNSGPATTHPPTDQHPRSHGESGAVVWPGALLVVGGVTGSNPGSSTAAAKTASASRPPSVERS